ncbi:type VI secretion system baseplate subunit TssG [Cronobacter sakazakii]|nr:type VI secretion system baseplate subunit TssG [Cronobacter sakazakii]ELY3828440.1 type VI secretion system baseplate subunit TssG [Cronobacter sakazakii]ELY4144635.1 type VI secretion system baseplate subunit TssG [Cronobacter sakazakii]
MERKPSVSFTRLNDAFGTRLPYSSFYRFLQWLEKAHPEYPPLGSSWRISDDPLRLRPYAGMGFPASEFKAIEPHFDEMGGFAWDVNSTIEIRLYTESKADVRGWMPPGYTLYHDLLSLLRVYLGWRYDACISLTFPRRLLPAPRLTARDHKDSVYMGYSFLLGHDPDDTGPDPEMPDEVTIKLGRYEGLKKNPTRREVTEVED